MMLTIVRNLRIWALHHWRVTAERGRNKPILWKRLETSSHGQYQPFVVCNIMELHETEQLKPKQKAFKMKRLKKSQSDVKNVRIWSLVGQRSPKNILSKISSENYQDQEGRSWLKFTRLNFTGTSNKLNLGQSWKILDNRSLLSLPIRDYSKPTLELS